MGQDERPVSIATNRCFVEVAVHQSLALLPIVLGEDSYAAIEDPHQRTAQPDQERRVKQTLLTHLILIVLVDDSNLGVPAGSEQPPKSEANAKIGARGKLLHRPQSPYNKQAIPMTIRTVP